MIKQIRKTLAATTIIMGSAVIAMLLFGTDRSGNSPLGTVARTAHQLYDAMLALNPVVIGIIVGIVLLTGVAFWVRGK